MSTNDQLLAAKSVGIYLARAFEENLFSTLPFVPAYCSYCISRRSQYHLLSNREIMPSSRRIYEHVCQSWLMSESPGSSPGRGVRYGGCPPTSNLRESRNAMVTARCERVLPALVRSYIRCVFGSLFL